MEKFYTNVFGNVYKTNNYSKFKRIIGNRSVDKGKIKKLIESMSEKQLVCPIIVNKNFEIIDGQHRFYASKELGLPVYYIQMDDYNIEDVQRANLVASTWDNEAFLNLHISMDTDNSIYYRNLLDIVDKYDVIISTVIKVEALFSRSRYKDVSDSFKNGSFVFSHYNEACEFFDSLIDCFSEYKHYTDDSFVIAYANLFIQDNFSAKTMKKQSVKFGYNLKHCKNRTKTGYMYTLTNDIYSFRKQNNKIYFDEIRNLFYNA